MLPPSSPFAKPARLHFPTQVARDVFLGAKCTVLGNIKIGCGATIAAAALVNKPVPAGYTAVGVPARLVAPKQPIDLKNAK